MAIVGMEVAGLGGVLRLILTVVVVLWLVGGVYI
jgi:hypothetical protein